MVLLKEQRYPRQMDVQTAEACIKFVRQLATIAMHSRMNYDLSNDVTATWIKYSENHLAANVKA